MKNWKTTVIGLIGAILTGGGTLLTQGNLDWKAYVMMAFMSVSGYFQKDAGTSGTGM